MQVQCSHSKDPLCPVNAMGVTCIHYFEHEWTEGCFGSAECADEDGKIYFVDVHCKPTAAGIAEEKARETRIAELTARRKALWKEVEQINKEFKSLTTVGKS